jgi:hypothetical protein
MLLSSCSIFIQVGEGYEAAASAYFSNIGLFCGSHHGVRRPGCPGEDRPLIDSAC